MNYLLEDSKHFCYRCIVGQAESGHFAIKTREMAGVQGFQLLGSLTTESRHGPVTHFNLLLVSHNLSFLLGMVTSQAPRLNHQLSNFYYTYFCAWQIHEMDVDLADKKSFHISWNFCRVQWLWLAKIVRVWTTTVVCGYPTSPQYALLS